MRWLNWVPVVAVVLGLVVWALVRGAFADMPDRTHPETGEDDAR